MMPISHGVTFQEFMEIVGQNKSLTILTISNVIKIFKVDRNDVELLANAFPALIGLDICQFRLTIIDAVFLMKQLKSLQKFVFILNYHSTKGDLENEMKVNGLHWHSLGISRSICGIKLVR